MDQAGADSYTERRRELLEALKGFFEKGGEKYDRTPPATASEAKSIISHIIESAKSIKDRVVRAVIGGLTHRQRLDFAQTGIEVKDNYIHTVENSAIRHNQKKHGNAEREASRGQIAIVEDDYQLIPDILENYDTVELSPNKNKQVNRVIIYRKEYADGMVYYLEEKRDGRDSLAFETMYKKKKGTDSSDGLMNNSSPSTSKTLSDNLNSGGKGSENSASDQINPGKNASEGANITEDGDGRRSLRSDGSREMYDKAV